MELIPLLLILLGFFFLIKGADWLVNGSSSLAKSYHVSDLAIGLTVVAFGTSAPELVVNSFASYNGETDLVFANIIGSNIFNLFAILGIIGMISPTIVQNSTIKVEIPISFAAIGILFVLSNSLLRQQNSLLSRWDGIILFLLFLAFLVYVRNEMKKHLIVAKLDDNPTQSNSQLKIWGLIILGLSTLILGGKLVVDNAVIIASEIGLSQKIIGLTIVAIGTSLPELATSIVAALKKNSDMAIGNIIGSNIFNILFILSISSLIKPLNYSSIFNMDLYFLAGGTLFLYMAMFTGKRKRLDTWEAAILLIAFIIYMAYLIIKELQPIP